MGLQRSEVQILSPRPSHLLGYQQVRSAPRDANLFETTPSHELLTSYCGTRVASAGSNSVRLAEVQGERRHEVELLVRAGLPVLTGSC